MTAFGKKSVEIASDAQVSADPVPIADPYKSAKRGLSLSQFASNLREFGDRLGDMSEEIREYDETLSNLGYKMETPKLIGGKVILNYARYTEAPPIFLKLELNMFSQVNQATFELRGYNISFDLFYTTQEAFVEKLSQIDYLEAQLCALKCDMPDVTLLAKSNLTDYLVIAVTKLRAVVKQAFYIVFEMNPSDSPYRADPIVLLQKGPQWDFNNNVGISNRYDLSPAVYGSIIVNESYLTTLVKFKTYKYDNLTADMSRIQDFFTPNAVSE